MKVLAILIALLFHCSAFAQTTSYSLLGKGVMNEAGNTIVLACVEFEALPSTECKTLSFVFFNGSTGKATPIGNRYSIKDHQIEAAAKEATKLMKQNIRSQINASSERNKWIGRTTFVSLLFGSGVLAVKYNSPIPIGSALTIFFLLALTDTDPSFLDPVRFVASASFTAGSLQLREVFLDQSGWNWPSKRKQISPKKFYRIFSAIID